ncbi:MAG: hypothetical protein HQK88_00235 [Nitrospirae bacterium]|nr:hypothetical protein [Nitrospirota bacterium]MBF0535156.1 hypothetical protein [Nitrospirota bacterium]MBF0615225.1 hypothetical protein [Nitrospirota bacterium]
MNNRLILLCFLVLYFVVFRYVFIQLNDYSITCKVFGVYSSIPANDLHVIACSMECLRKGMDIQSKEVNDLCGGYFNYTRFARLLVYTGIMDSHTKIIAIVLIILYFFVLFRFIGEIDVFGLIVYIILLYSPALMLLIERVNIDMPIFIALYISLYFLRRNKSAISALIILFVSFIKLYPICALSMYLNKNFKNNIKILIFTLLAYLLYIFLIRGEFTAIYNLTGRGLEYSYGAQIFIDSMYPFLKGWGVTRYVPFSLEQFHVLFFLMALLMVSLGVSMGLRQQINDEDTVHIDGLRVGAGIYIGTFLIGNNWVYRLCFLLFTVPQILKWCKKQKAMRSLSIIALMCITVYIYNDYWAIRMLVNFTLLFYAKELAAWFLLFYYSYAFSLTIPFSTRSLFSPGTTFKATVYEPPP